MGGVIGLVVVVFATWFFIGPRRNNDTSHDSYHVSRDPSGWHFVPGRKVMWEKMKKKGGR